MIDFLGIGAQKSGTTWLMKNLRKHPDIWTPFRLKELHYFSVLYLGFDKESRLELMRCKYEKIIKKESRNNSLTHEKHIYLNKVYDPDFAFTDEWYKYIFSFTEGKIKGEITPFYCALGKRGISHVKRIMPDVKLIYMIRDPYDRAMSSLRMLVDRGEDEQRSMEELIDDSSFIIRGDYARNIPAWEEVFSANQIHYIPFGRIKSDPIGILRGIETYLGLDPLDDYPSITNKVNATGKNKKINIPDNISQKIRDMTESQYPFLRERFGKEFVTNTR